MRTYLFLVFLILWLVLTGCLNKSSNMSSLPNTSDGVSEEERVRKFSDDFVTDIVNDQPKESLDKMEKDFRRRTDINKFSLYLAQLFEVYGSLTSCKYKKYDIEVKIILSGEEKPMRKFWYACGTSKYEMGSHFLFVEVINYGTESAVSSFAIVTFPQGIPKDLQ